MQSKSYSERPITHSGPSCDARPKRKQQSQDRHLMKAIPTSTIGALSFRNRHPKWDWLYLITETQAPLTILLCATRSRVDNTDIRMFTNSKYILSLSLSLPPSLSLSRFLSSCFTSYHRHTTTSSRRQRWALRQCDAHYVHQGENIDKQRRRSTSRQSSRNESPSRNLEMWSTS